MGFVYESVALDYGGLVDTEMPYIAPTLNYTQHSHSLVEEQVEDEESREDRRRRQYSS